MDTRNDRTDSEAARERLDRTVAAFRRALDRGAVGEALLMGLLALLRLWLLYTVGGAAAVAAFVARLLRSQEPAPA